MSRYRIYIPNAAYHITFNPKYRWPYFNEDIFCSILAEVIRSAQVLKDYELIAYKINPEHVHILLKCGKEYNLSQIVHAIRRVSSVRINQVITKGTIDERTQLIWSPDQLVYARAFEMKYGSSAAFPFPMFKWQDGFNDVLMRTHQQLINVRRYIRNQAVHHQLLENVHLFISQKIPQDIVYPVF